MKAAPGHSYCEHWSSMPFPRMPNVSLLPATKNISEEEVMANTRHGIFIEGDGSYSIDQQRYNFQFGGQTFWEIRNGRKTRMLRDVAYVARTPEFWNSMVMVGGRETYQLGGSFSDAKGQPMQLSSVSHGCPVALFRDVLTGSDLAPKLSGIRETDDARSSELVAAVLEALPAILRAGGNLLIKLFMGGAFDLATAELHRRFEEFRTTRPEATRKASAEVYGVGRRYRRVPAS